MKILAISGSLRAASINTALLHAAVLLAPSHMEVIFYPSMAELPLFNPDLELTLPAAVARFHSEVASADALLIASPEYAHGVTGTIKNALDWLVSFEPFVGKPVGVLNASPRAHHAETSLHEILTTMSAVIVEAACVRLPLLGTQFKNTRSMIESPAISKAIQGALDALDKALPG